MSESKRLSQQIKQAFQGPCWAGPSLLDVLENVDVITASAKPIPDSHSIWELVMHLISGQQIMLRFVRGQTTIAATAAEWWQPVPDHDDEVSWTETLETLKKQESELVEAVAEFPDSKLDDPFVEGGSSAYNNLAGHAQHTLYHAGQILMLKRAQGVK
ncbi:MAG: hypothetical protein Kow0074_09830 [Candidatus Zixiibacteriota bacterium]